MLLKRVGCWLQDYRVHIKHTDGRFEYVPYFCLPANELTDVIAPSCYACFDYTNGLADLVGFQIRASLALLGRRRGWSAHPCVIRSCVCCLAGCLAFASQFLPVPFCIVSCQPPLYCFLKPRRPSSHSSCMTCFFSLALHPSPPLLSALWPPYIILPSW